MDEELEDEVVSTDIIAPTFDIVVYPSAKLPPQYIAMVYSKWLKSLRFGNPLFKKIGSREYYKNYHQFINNLMKKPDSVIKLALLTDDHDVVLGFSVSREDVLDYIVVQGHARRVGIAKAIFPAGLTTFTHLTKTGMNIWQDNPKYKHLKFNPFA